MTTHRVSLAVAALVAAAALLPAAPSTDISWIGRLPGLTSGVQNEEGDTIKVIYSVTGDPEKTLELVLEGLEDRGWNVRRTGLAALGITSMQAVRATKGDALLKIAFADGAASSTLILKLTGGATEPPARAESATIEGRSGRDKTIVRDASGSVAVDSKGRVVIKDERSGDRVTVQGGQVVAKDRRGETVVVGSGSAAAAQRVTINDNEVSRRIECRPDTEVVVNGNDCAVTLVGKCHLLSIKGDDNRADAQGPIEEIKVLGDDNLVTWSAEENATRPRIEDLGTDNVIRSSSR